MLINVCFIFGDKYDVGMESKDIYFDFISDYYILRGILDLRYAKFNEENEEFLLGFNCIFLF